VAEDDVDLIRGFCIRGRYFIVSSHILKKELETVSERKSFLTFFDKPNVTTCA
jgi:hypothetical protein